jgi:hypothetical protein
MTTYFDLSGWFRGPVLPADCKPVEDSKTLLFGSTPNPASIPSLYNTQPRFSSQQD